MNSKSLLIERVYSLELTQRATLVAFYLINRADSEGTCFPGVKTIAKDCNISTRTVQRALNDLEDAGFLVRESRFHEQGGQRSNLYYLQVLEEEKNHQQPVEPQNYADINGSDAINTEPNNTNNKESYKTPISIDLSNITFKEMLGECVSGSPCHDGIP